MGECLVGTHNCFECCNIGHKFKDFPNVKGQEKGSGKVSGSYVDAPTNNHFYDLHSRGEQENSPDVVNVR